MKKKLPNKGMVALAQQTKNKCNPNCAYFSKCQHNNPYKPNKVCMFDNKYIINIKCECHRGNALIL